tara:strand:- start:470 stop:604 length:135 start_codon:yes stop_codon:yes gene_type:complete
MLTLSSNKRRADNLAMLSERVFFQEHLMPISVILAMFKSENSSM